MKQIPQLSLRRPIIPFMTYGISYRTKPLEIHRLEWPVADYDIVGLRQKKIAGLTVIGYNNYEEKILSIQTIQGGPKN